MAASDPLSTDSMRLMLISLLLVSAGPATVLAQQPDHVEVGTGTDIHARIEIERTDYSLGDTACVRVTLVNTSDRNVGYTAMTGASDMVHLVIKRGGQLVHPNVEPAGSSSAAGGSFPARGVAPLAQGQWLPITYWGYKLEEDGEYTIEGIPQIPDDTTTVRSNEVAFTLARDSQAHPSCKVVPYHSQGLDPAERQALVDSLFKARRAQVESLVKGRMAR